jgi:hypothetical protein
MRSRARRATIRKADGTQGTADYISLVRACDNSKTRNLAQ